MKRILIYIIALLVSAGAVYTCSRVPGCRTTDDGKWRDTFFLKELNLYVMVDGSDPLRRVYLEKNDSVFSDHIGYRYSNHFYIQYYFPGGDSIVITDIYNLIPELESQNFHINHVKGTIGPVWKNRYGAIEGTVLSDSSIFSKRAYTMRVMTDRDNDVFLRDPNDSLIYNSIDSVRPDRRKDDVLDAILRILLYYDRAVPKVYPKDSG